MEGPILITLIATFFLLPSLIAAARDHKNVSSIVALNVLLGWSGLFWIVSLIWSLTDNTYGTKRINSWN